MKRSSVTHSVGVIFGVSLVTGVLLGGFVIGKGNAGLASAEQPAVGRTCGDFAREQVAGGPHETVYDPQTNTLTVYQGPTRYDLVLASAECSNSSGQMRRIIDLALERYQQTTQAKCAAWSRFLAEGKTSLKGRTIKAADVQTYMAEVC